MENGTNSEKRNNIEAELRLYHGYLSGENSEYGDWKGNKINDYKAMGWKMPYSEDEITDYYKTRDEYRAKIKELESELMKL